MKIKVIVITFLLSIISCLTVFADTTNPKATEFYNWFINNKIDSASFAKISSDPRYTTFLSDDTAFYIVYLTGQTSSVDVFTIEKKMNYDKFVLGSTNVMFSTSTSEPTSGISFTLDKATKNIVDYSSYSGYYGSNFQIAKYSDGVYSNMYYSFPQLFQYLKGNLNLNYIGFDSVTSSINTQPKLNLPPTSGGVVDLNKANISIKSPTNESVHSGKAIKVTGTIVQQSKKLDIDYGQGLKNVFLKGFTTNVGTISELNILESSRAIDVGGKWVQTFPFSLIININSNFNDSLILSTNVLEYDTQKPILVSDNIKINFTYSSEGGVSNGDSFPNQSDTDPIKPTRPTSVNPVEWIIYIFDLFDFYMSSLFQAIIGVFKTLFDNFVVLGGVVGQGVGKFATVFAMMPKPLPDLITFTFIIISVTTAIRYFRR